jgi:hypothetical protein
MDQADGSSCETYSSSPRFVPLHISSDRRHSVAYRV